MNTSDSMIERVTRAIADHRGISEEDRTFDMMAVFRMDARAAIEAMRDPTGKMLRSVDGEAEDVMVARGRAYSAWQAMIDEALS